MNIDPLTFLIKYLDFSYLPSICVSCVGEPAPPIPKEGSGYLSTYILESSAWIATTKSSNFRLFS